MTGLHPMVAAAILTVAASACSEPPAAVDATPGTDSDSHAADASPLADAGAEHGFLPDAVGIVNLVMSDFAGPDVGCFAVLRDGPPLPGLERVAEEGECVIWRRVAPGFCENPCAEFCTPEGSCVPYPANQSAGTIEVSGLRGPLAFEPTASGYRTVTTIEGDLFDPDATIVADAAGGEVPGFSLSTTGVQPFEDEIELIALEDDVDAVVTWNAASSGRIQLALRLGWHGAPFTDMLLCETDDTGSLVIPGALISRFPYFEGGLFQVPSSIGRFRRDVVTTPDGEVELFVGSMRYIGFVHAFPE